MYMSCFMCRKRQNLESVKTAVINTLLTYCPRARGQPRTVSVKVCTVERSHAPSRMHARRE